MNPLFSLKLSIALISPIVPHLGEELWSILGHTDTIAYESWPTYVDELTYESERDIAVQVNGKVRAIIKVSDNDTEDDVKNKALREENVIKYTEGKEIIKRKLKKLRKKIHHLLMKTMTLQNKLHVE